eukprot:2254164-Heterocapsa_arctica.AAC.1
MDLTVVRRRGHGTPRGGLRLVFKGLRASSLSPSDSSQNADHVVQHMSLKPMLSFNNTLQHC